MEVLGPHPKKAKRVPLSLVHINSDVTEHNVKSEKILSLLSAPDTVINGA